MKVGSHLFVVYTLPFSYLNFLPLAGKAESRGVGRFWRYALTLHNPVAEVGLHHFHVETTAPSKYSRQEMEEGAKLVEDVFRAWTTQNRGEDIIMSETNEDDEVATRLEHLKVIFQQYQPQIEANSWCRDIIYSL